jgi:hypothetical protein
VSLDDIRQLGETSESEKVYEREHTFVVRYKCPEGRQYEAAITSKILSGDDRNKVARIAAQIAACPWDQLPMGEQIRIYGLAVCSVALDSPPDWINKFITEDPALLGGIYEEVARHDTGWFRSGGGSGSEDEEEARVSISSEAPTSTPDERMQPISSKPMLGRSV